MQAQTAQAVNTASLTKPSNHVKDGQLHLHIDLTNAVEVHAADFNGKTFDGTPITGYEFGKVPDWFIKNATKEDTDSTKVKIHVESRSGTDYAWFGVEDQYYNIHWAGPGDYIVRIDDYHWVVIPGVLVKHKRIDPLN